MARFTASQPSCDISTPELNEATVTRPMTRKSLSPCTRARSSGRWAPASMVVAPMKPRFQPTPTSASATLKWMSWMPESATTAPAASSASPAAITRGER